MLLNITTLIYLTKIKTSFSYSTYPWKMVLKTCLNMNKAVEMDSNLAKFLKEAAFALAYPLSKIINLSES